MATTRNPATPAPKRAVTGVRLAKRVAPQRKTGVRELSAQATRESILKAATRVFAKYGFDGGSVEKISKAAKSVDRMLYYYFGNKEGLFIAVIEDMYRQMNEAEAELDRALFDDHSEDPARVGAERHADAVFVGALADRE